MKHFKFIAVFLFILTACKKETNTTPKLSFNEVERNWFIYHIGQSYKFKNYSGETIEYIVTDVRNDFRTEYKDPFTNPVEIGQTEFYAVDLHSNTDSFFIYFYKEFQYNSDPNKMRQTIRWNKMTGEFVVLAALENQTPFITKTINGFTYKKVTQANPTGDMLYPWTIWGSANYDQDFGFIELIDLNGISWLRQ